MNVKLTPMQWLQLIATALPMLRGVFKLVGFGAVAFIRQLVDLIGALEQAIPNEPEIPGQPPRRRGAERLEQLREAVATMFEAAELRLDIFEKAWPEIAAFVTVAVDLLKKWKGFIAPAAAAVKALT